MYSQLTDVLGQRIGTYRLIQPLGQSDRAEVYLGEHVRLGTPAAIKIFHATLSEETTSAFQRETQALAKLGHPYLVRLLDSDVNAGVPFLVMDYHPNGSLQHLYPIGTRVPREQVVILVQHLATVLDFLHQQQVLHLAVKPANMLLSQTHEVLLSDIRLASALVHMQAAPIKEELFFQAPEQLQGQPGPASDQYALAICAYLWLSGTVPFQGNMTEIIARHLTI